MSDNLFDMSGIGNFLSTMTQAANQKAVAAKETAEVALTEKAAIADSATQYQQEAQKALGRLQTVNAKGEDARAKAESLNIIDRVTLIGDQILDPRNYTAEGRSRQISEMSQSLAAQGQIHNIEVNASAARIDEQLAKETLQTIGVDTKMNILRAQVDGLNLMNNAIAQTETLRQNALVTVDLATVQQALAAPENPELKGKIALQGMTYTPYELKQRETQLLNREKLAMLAPQALDPDFAQKMRVHHDMQLANYSRADLDQLRSNGYVMPDGTQVEPGIWDSHYNRQNTLEQDLLTRQMNEATLEQQVPMMLQESQTMVQNIDKFVTPGSPLSVAKNNFLVAANGVATLAASDKTPQGKLVQVTALQKAQEGLIKAVDKEATFKAAGDKALADIYRSQMLGQPISPAQVEDVVRQRYMRGAGFSEILPNESSIRVRKNADTNYLKLKQAAAGNLDPLAPNKSDKELKEEAINLAIEQERNEAGVIGINTIQRVVGQRKDNPAVKAGMVPGQLEEIQMRAHTIALETVGHAEGLSQDQILALKSGRPNDAGITDEKAAMIAQAVNIESVMTEYDLYEQQRPGLGYEMQQWYASTLPELAKTYTNNLDSMQRVLTGDSVLIEAQKLAQMYTMADESATNRGRRLATEQATGARRPENMWPVLLHMQKNLADSQKATIYRDVIMPAIQQARARGANDEATTGAVFDALNAFKSDDPTLMSAIKTTQRGLPDELDRFETMWSTLMIQGQPHPIRGQKVANNPKLAAEQLEVKLPWLKK